MVIIECDSNDSNNSPEAAVNLLPKDCFFDKEPHPGSTEKEKGLWRIVTLYRGRRISL